MKNPEIISLTKSDGSHYIEIDSLRMALKVLAEANPDAYVCDFVDHINLHLTKIKRKRRPETWTES